MRAFERFLNYVKVHTTSSITSGMHPSYEGEWNLARQLAEEMEAIGIQEVCVDEHAYVYGRIPASAGLEHKPAIGFLAHMDTSPDASGEGVKPQLFPDYDGSDIRFTGCDKVMTVKEFPFLPKFAGETLIVGDGTTLLGADDKAGIAEIMTAAEQIIADNKPHTTIFICFTPDEEIGEGTDNIDLKQFPVQYAYTLDGGDVNELEYENFNAASARIVVNGFSTHPGDAKDKMVNSIKVACELQSLLPESECPECTEGREGFFHLEHMEGSIARTDMHIIIRDHDRQKFEHKKMVLTLLTEALNDKYGPNTVCMTITDTYYNMLEKIEPHKHLVDNALEAIRSVGMNPVTIPIRGGTDGARLSYMGIPTPNLGTGVHNFHSVFECITAERMDKAVDVILHVVNSYSR